VLHGEQRDGRGNGSCRGLSVERQVPFVHGRFSGAVPVTPGLVDHQGRH